MIIRYLYNGALVLLVIATALLPGCSSNDSGNPVKSPAYRATDFFVSAANGEDSNSGKVDAPFATIQRAIDTAAVTGGRVFVAEGTYNENVVLAKGVSIFGGYKDSTFARDTAAVTTINGSDVAMNVTNSDTLTIDGFTINCADATTPGGSSIGISLSDSRGVTITHNVIHVGKGAAGLNQSKPATPHQGSPDGLSGIDANNDDCNLSGCPLATPGGNGGGWIEPWAAGGLGGGGGWSRGSGFPKSDDGDDGLGLGGGIGGAGKAPLGGRGGDGGNGGAGLSVGANGSGGVAFGSIQNGAYIPSPGDSGGLGSYGGGGGGGGGGGAVLAKGGSGGGGGAGGRGGLPGPGGGGGGASIGILVSGNSQAIINSNSITTGNGGAGGAGAPGGDPGRPGNGGAGGGWNGWGGAGGDGGNGGAGKAGGSGGGGGGGSSIGIVEAASSSTTLTNNAFIHAPGGSGGSSSGNKGADGEVVSHLKL